MNYRIILFLLPALFLFSSCKDNDPGSEKGNEGGNNDGSPLTYQVFSDPADKTFIFISYRESEDIIVIDTVENGWSKVVTLEKGTRSFLSADAVLKKEYQSSGNLSVTTRAQIIQNNEIVLKKEGKNLSLDY